MPNPAFVFRGGPRTGSYIDERSRVLRKSGPSRKVSFAAGRGGSSAPPRAFGVDLKAEDEDIDTNRPII
jgi:hypothetical protein